MHPVSDETRWKIVFTWQQLKSVRATARELGLTYSVVQHWVDTYKTTGAVTPQTRKGPPRQFSADMAREAKMLLLDGDCDGAQDAALQLHTKGITPKLFSASTVVRAAKRQATEDGQPIRAVRGRPAKRLTAATMAKRLAFARLNKTRAWQRVMFTDRKKFMFSHPGCKVRQLKWVRQGETKQETTVNHPMALNVYAGVTVSGVTACAEVAGSSKHTTVYKNKKGQPAKNITAGEYKDVMKNTLLPEGRRLMSRAGLSSWVYQQDNDPSHHAAGSTLQSYNKARGTSIELLKHWPPNSPDLSPIENVWSYVQRRVSRRGYKTFPDYKAAVLKELETVPPHVLKNLFKSMPKRIEKVIATDGGKTKY